MSNSGCTIIYNRIMNRLLFAEDGLGPPRTLLSCLRRRIELPAQPFFYRPTGSTQGTVLKGGRREPDGFTLATLTILARQANRMDPC